MAKNKLTLFQIDVTMTKNEPLKTNLYTTASRPQRKDVYYESRAFP